MWLIIFTTVRDGAMQSMARISMAEIVRRLRAGIRPLILRSGEKTPKRGGKCDNGEQRPPALFHKTKSILQRRYKRVCVNDIAIIRSST
jgi:hypothetical protein